MSEWLDNLKVGDSVIYYPAYRQDSPVVSSVIRATATQVRIAALPETIFRRSGLGMASTRRESGRSSWGRRVASIREATPENLARVERDECEKKECEARQSLRREIEAILSKRDTPSATLRVVLDILTKGEGA